ncbi:MAG: amidohydrolase family protein [Burkholderiales bacterium]|nr:amidohydrolase family protein [Burkholderiales bacterium]
MSATTWIRNAAWVVAWDAKRQAHRYLRDADVVFTANVIDHVGPGYRGRFDTQIDGSELCVMPGLVAIHCHPTNQPITRGIREELGNPKMYMTALYDRTNLWPADDEGMLNGVRVALGEMLKSGVTSVIDFANKVPQGWLDVLVESGLRIFAAPAFRDAQWVVKGGSHLTYEWDEKVGREAMERSLALVEAASKHPSGRLAGVIAPSQVDTCTARTLQESARIAHDRGLMWQTHGAQTLSEFHEMTRRHGKTPVQWLHEIGVLGPWATVAHCLFIDEHPWTHWAERADLRVLAETGTTVAHCPVVFSRYGQTMHSLGKYLRAGVNIGIGCDSAPHNMLEEMRQALILSRVASADIHDISTSAVFHAATVGGARAFRREDIGRLAAGAKADLVLLDLTNRYMRPMRDPLRNLIYTAADRAVRDVYVDGVRVLAAGEVRTMDIPAATAALESAQRRAEATVGQRDPQGRSGIEVSPLVLPLD